MKLGRLFITTAMAGATGAAAGLLAAYLLWGYAISPPRLDYSEVKGSPIAASVFIVEHGECKEIQGAARKEFFESELKDCEQNPHCTFGISINHFQKRGRFQLFSETPSGKLICPLTQRAQVIPSSLLTSRNISRGMTIETSSGDQFLAFISDEISNDRFIYLEALVPRPEDNRAAIFSHFRFEIAGLEFLTPGILVAVGMAAFIGLWLLLSLALHLVRRFRQRISHR